MSNENNKLIPELRFPEFINDGEWVEKKLEEVCEINPRASNIPEQFVYIDLESVENGNLLQKKIIKSDGAPSRAQRLLQENDIVFQMVRPYQKNNYYFLKDDAFEYVASTGYAQLRSFQSSQYLYQFIHTDAFVSKVLEKCTGSNYPAINASDLSQISVQIPKPQEQQKIASCLSSLDEVIAAHSQKLEALKEHKKGLMQTLFSQEGETVPKYRFPEFINDGEWVEKKLSEVCKMQAGKFVSASEIKDKFTEGLYPCYGGNGLRGYTSSFTHTGTYSLIGRQGALCGNVTLVDGRFHATEHAVVVTPDENVHTIWLFYVLELLNLNQYATGQAQPGLSVNNLEQVKLNLPENPKEQERIATCLSSLDALITAQANLIVQLKLHKKGLMQGLFPKIND